MMQFDEGSGEGGQDRVVGSVRIWGGVERSFGWKGERSSMMIKLSQNFQQSTLVDFFNYLFKQVHTKTVGYAQAVGKPS